MDIGIPIKDLGEYDIEPLKAKIMALPEEAWWGNQFRQLEYEVHQHTQSVVMVFTDGDGWPNIEVSKDEGWDLLADEALPLMHQILEDHYPPGAPLSVPWQHGSKQAASSSRTPTIILHSTLVTASTSLSTPTPEYAS